jgi:cyclic pyranopterin phosphate synthase
VDQGASRISQPAALRKRFGRRVTAEGRLLLCLGQEYSTDLRRIQHATRLDEDAVKRAIVEAMPILPKGRDVDPL